MQMDLNAVHTLVGSQAKARLAEVLQLMYATKWPIFFTGPSGSGKTHLAMSIAKRYSRKMKVPAYYVQLSPDMTKTSLILGLRLVNGSLVPVKGLLANAMEEGAAVVVDEATHTTQEVLLMFNSVMDRTSVTSIGDEIVYAADSFRLIFCANSSMYSGNVRLPQSFAQRLVSFNFDYPSLEDEIAIALRIAQDEFSRELSVPDSLVRYVTSFIRDQRNPMFPLSARNVAIATILCAIAKEGVEDVEEEDIDDYFSSGPNVESVRRSISARILGSEAESVYALIDKRVTSFLRFVSAIGIPRFREIMLSACMYHLDVDGTDLNIEDFRNQLYSSVI